jgi:hypothetical protein
MRAKRELEIAIRGKFGDPQRNEPEGRRAHQQGWVQGVCSGTSTAPSIHYCTLLRLAQQQGAKNWALDLMLFSLAALFSLPQTPLVALMWRERKTKPNTRRLETPQGEEGKYVCGRKGQKAHLPTTRDKK